MKKIYIYTSLMTIFIISIVFLSPSITSAEDKCVFGDTLELGSEGEEVRCLQKYLNAAGFTVSTSGGGSSGNETDAFREKTKEAVKKWQIANGIYPATGNFGPLSRSIYEVLTANKVTVPATTSGGSNTTTVVSNGSLGVQTTTTNTSSAASVSSLEKEVRKLMKTVRDEIDAADEDIEDEEDDGIDVADMVELSEKAKDKLIDGVYAFIDGDFEESKTLLLRAQKYSEDSIEDIKNDEDMADAEDAIQDAKEALNSTRDDINEADDDGDDVDEALDIYNNAKSIYNDAREAFDDEDYEEAIELAEEAEDLADEAVDAL